MAIAIGIDALSLARLREAEIGLQCRCGETHRIRIRELHRGVQERLPELRLRNDTSGISG